MIFVSSIDKRYKISPPPNGVGLGPNKHWPLVCHHMEYKKGEPWSLVALCNSTINLGLEYLEGDPAADP